MMMTFLNNLLFQLPANCPTYKHKQTPQESVQNVRRKELREIESMFTLNLFLFLSGSSFY